jgi:FkbM family methyltransferase
MNLAQNLGLLARLISTVRNWPLYFRVRYGKSPERVAYKLRNGITITSRSRAIDGMALNDVWLEETYEPGRKGLPFDWKACKTIVDIGANIGTFTLFAAHNAPQAKIVSVEPEPGNLVQLRINIAGNNIVDRVTIVEAGVGPEETTATFHVAHKNSGGHSLYHYTENSHPVEVKIIPLKTIFERNHLTGCDYLKLDCEGGEYDALYGMPDEILKNIPFMAIEYHHFSKDSKHTPVMLKAFLEAKGFTVIDAKKSIFFAYRTPTQG